MPILAKEPSLFPGHLLEGREAPPELGERWWALYSLARHEKQLMRRLQGLGASYFAPLVGKRNRSPAGRVRTSYVPLFPGYVFLFGRDADRRAAMTTNCVSRCLDVTDGPQLFEDLQRVHRLIESGEPLTPEAKLIAGDRVRVRSGALTGMEGVVLQRHNERRLLVAVNFLQRGASVRLDECQLEVLP